MCELSLLTNFDVCVTYILRLPYLTHSIPDSGNATYSKRDRVTFIRTSIGHKLGRWNVNPHHANYRTERVEANFNSNVT